MGVLDSSTEMNGSPAEDAMLPSDANDEHDCVSEFLRSFPLRKKSFTLLRCTSTPSSSSGSSCPPSPAKGGPTDPDRAAKRPGKMAEEDSTSPLFLPVTRSFSFPNVERGLSSMVRSYMLAVMLLRVNWTVTCSSPRSFSFRPALECSLSHLKIERKKSAESKF